MFRMQCLVASVLLFIFMVGLKFNCFFVFFYGLLLIETVELGRQESLAAIGKRGLSHRELEKEARRMIGNDLDDLWKRAQDRK